MGAEIYHLVSPICPDEANVPGYGQHYIFCSSETRTIGLENQSNKGCMAMLRQVKPDAESYKRIHQIEMKYINEGIKLLIFN
jgi:hypothetical protein